MSTKKTKKPKLSKLGTVLVAALDQPDSWSLKISSSGRLHLQFKPIVKTGIRHVYTMMYMKYQTMPRKIKTFALKLDVSTKYDFDLVGNRCLSPEDKQAMWPKAEALIAMIKKDMVIPEFAPEPTNPYIQNLASKRRESEYAQLMQKVLNVHD